MKESTAPIKVVPISPDPKGKVDGISTYCHALAQLFEDCDEVAVTPPLNCPVKESRLVNFVFGWKNLYKTMKATKADVVHVNGYTAFNVFQSLVMARLLRKRVVYTAHWHPFRMLRRPALGKVFFYVLIRPFLGFADRIVTINSEDTAFFSFAKDRVRRIPHWNRFKADVLPAPVEKDKRMILFIGRFNAFNKGFDYLYHLPEGEYDIHCVGKGEVEVRSDMTIHTNIPDEELRALYARASLVVIPSMYEAFSYVTLEALAMNTPVLMSDRVRIADYLGDCQGAEVFAYGDFDAFVRKVATHIGSPVDREKVLEIFSPENIRKKYAEVYREAMG
ncbi:MAG: glycosyltransferase family 4 protein [Prevotella sp.]|nr:glycosyltransferase family 4 protein [Prevotella sp.]